MGGMNEQLKTAVEEQGATLRQTTDEMIPDTLKQEILSVLERRGFIENKDGKLVCDVEKLMDKEFLNETIHNYQVSSKGRPKGRANLSDITKVLSQLTAFEKKEYEQSKKAGSTPSERPFINLPENEQSAIKGEYNNKGILELESLRKRTNWVEQLSLSDGSVFAYGELFFSRKLKELGATRDNGKLTVLDPTTGKRKPFSARLFLDALGKVPTFSKKKYIIHFSKNPVEFIQTFLPRLFKDKVLQEADFDEVANTLFYLEKTGYIEDEGNIKILDLEKLKNYDPHGKNKEDSRNPVPNLSQVLEALAKERFVKKGEGNKTVLGKPQPVLRLPLHEQAAIRGEFDNDGMVNIEDLYHNTPWGKTIQLEDGSEFNYAELFIARKLRDLKAKRNEQGQLQLFDERDGRYKTFSAKLFVELSGNNPCVTDKELTRQSKKAPGHKFEGRLQLDVSGALFAERYLTRLTKNKVIEITDFLVSNRGQASELFRPNDQHWGDNNPYVYFNSERGGGLRYYLGRKNIVGTDTPITKESIARQLDTKTIGIIDKSYGRENILYYFTLLSPDDVRQRHDEAVTRAGQIKPSASWLSMNSYVGGVDMKNRIQPYRVTDLVSQKRDEGAEQYAERVAKLSDTKFVTESFSMVFRQAGIGTHKLPWREQLLIADFAMNKQKEAKLLPFVKRYGFPGLRTFLSLEYGRELGDDIIALGETLPKEQAEKIFAKYGELVDAATEAETSAREYFPEAKLTPELVSTVRENLLRRGRDMLASFTAEVKASKDTSYEPVVAHLEQELKLLRADAALFAATFRELSASGEKLNLSEMKDVTFEQGISPEVFSPEDRERMKDIYRVNYKEYPEFQKRLLQDFDGVLREKTNRFYLLRYKGAIEGFYRLGKTEQDTVYFGAFNMNPKYAGSGLGEALMKQSLDIRAKESVIEANCVADKSIVANYIERGFIGTHTKQVNEPHLMYISRHDSQNNLFASKSLAPEEIIRTCGATIGYICKKLPLESVTHTDLAILDEKTADGTRHVLTRYIRDKQSKFVYLVFEKVAAETIEKYLQPEKPVLFEAPS